MVDADALNLIELSAGRDHGLGRATDGQEYGGNGPVADGADIDDPGIQILGDGVRGVDGVLLLVHQALVGAAGGRSSRVDADDRFGLRSGMVHVVDDQEIAVLVLAQVDRVVDEVSMANERLLAGTEVDLPHPSGVGAGVVARFIRYVDRVVRAWYHAGGDAEAAAAAVRNERLGAGGGINLDDGVHRAGGARFIGDVEFAVLPRQDVRAVYVPARGHEELLAGVRIDPDDGAGSGSLEIGDIELAIGGFRDVSG